MRKLYASPMGYILPLVWVCFFLISGRLSGQCYPPSEPPTQYCFPAPLVCLQNVCYDIVPWGGTDFFAEPEDWCMTTNPSHNPQYYLFQATADFVQIHIAVTTCHGQALCGLQAVIIDQCAVGFNPWTEDNIVACDALACINEELILAPANMVPGAYYWLMIDSDGDDPCAYMIDYLEGVYMPPIEDELTSAGTLDSVVCPGWQHWLAYADPPLPDVQGYLWTGFPWAPGYHTSHYANMAGGEWVDIPDDAPPGTYQICVYGYTGCDTTDVPACFNLQIRDPNGVSDPVTLCPEEFGNGLTWEGIAINGPGIYTQSYVSDEGCPYDSTKEFLSYPETFDGYIDTVFCGEEFVYEDEEFFNPGYYSLYYEGGNSYGCDSFAILTLDLTYIEAHTDFHCLNGSFVLTSDIVLAVPNANGLQYAWYRDDTVLVSTAPTFTTTIPGTYTLFVNSYQCTFPAVTNPIVIDLDELLPPQPTFDQISYVECANDTAVYHVIPDFNPVMRYYEWSTDPPGVPMEVFDTLNAGVRVYWQGHDSGTVCVHAVNHCGVGADTCFDVTIIPAPTAAFSLPAQVCDDSVVTIQFTGTGTPDAFYSWNFGGGIVQNGGSGPGPYEVQWSTPGMHTVSLQVAEEQCDTSSVTHNIFIEHLGQPVISCTSTLSSVTFEWEPVSGALNYQVNVLQGPSGTIMDDTSYVVTGLPAGSVVEIEVTASGTGACPATSSTAQCTAQSCPPRMIQIQIAADTFCLGDVSGVIPLSALVDGNPASGTWSGPGVDPTGTFDPNDPLAGPGVHTIVFMYSEGTCDYQRSRNVTVIATPTATFTADAAICQTSTASVTYTGNASVNANYMWDFGTGVANGSGAGPYTVSWNTAGTHDITLVVEEDGCASESITHSVDVQPALSMPMISCFPTTSSVTIQWSTVPNATAYDVIQLFGQAGAVNGNEYDVTGLSPGDSVAIQITVSGNTICPPVVIVASCVAQECPTPTIVIDPVDDICLYPGTGTVDLNVTVTNGNGTGVWSGTGITDVQQGIFDPNVAGPGSHLVEYEYTDNGCSFVESVMIDVYDPPSAVISNTSLTLTCENNSELILDGTSSSGQGALTYIWSTSNGMIVGPNDQATATAGSAGDYTLTVIDQVSLCEDDVSVTLVEDTGLPVADAGADALINCAMDFAVLGGNSSSGPSFAYAWSSTDGGIIDSDPNAAVITVSEGGTYVITVTDQDNGCTAVDQAFVSVDDAQPSGVLSVGDVLDCDVSSTTVTSMVSPPGSYTYQWTTTNGQILSGDGTPAILVDRAGIYTLIVTSDANGCMDTVSAEVLADPEVIAGLNVTVDNPNCVGDNDGMIEIVQVIGGTSPYTYAWSNQTSGSGLLFLSPGTYTVTVSDAIGCSFMESFTLPEPIDMSPDIGPDLTVDYGDSVKITLYVTDPGGIAEVNWEGMAPPCPGCLVNTFEGVASGNVTVTVIDTNGCEYTDALRLTVDISRNVYIPNVFSPNHDGINDLFTIRGKILDQIKSLRIFDRWGGLVFQETSVLAGGDEGWDGTFNGKQLDPGVYVYTALLVYADGLEENVTGSVTLIR